MGAIGMFSNGSIDTPNPNPKNFKILSQTIVNDNSILLVHYPGCTTFDGKKLLLLVGEYSNSDSLDPHLLGGEHKVIARFEPNLAGKTLAKICAENL